MTELDISRAIKPVVEAFNRLGVMYYIGGSVASSAYGRARATQDIDFISDLSAEKTKAFVELLQSDYYIDEQMILSAIQSRSSFNLIHHETAWKIDIFIAKQGPYPQVAMERKRKDQLDDSPDALEVYLAAPEDIILSKLDWFEQGGKVSERQWSDVIGIFKVQGNALDVDYLKSWAHTLGMIELLNKAFQEIE